VNALDATVVEAEGRARGAATRENDRKMEAIVYRMSMDGYVCIRWL